MAKLRVDKIAAPIIKDEYTGSVYFDGTGDYLSMSDSSDFDLGISNEPFTWELWFYKTAAAGTHCELGVLRGGGTAGWNATNGHQYRGFQYTDNKLYWQWWNGSTNINIISSLTPAINTWHHFAVSYDGTTTRAFLNGVIFGTSTEAYAKPSASNITRIGQDPSNSVTAHGYHSNVRICKGHAVYTENFTPPTRELEVHTGAKGVVFPAADNRTVLLACQSSTDVTAEATGRHTITAAGNAHAQSANPGLLRKTNTTSTITETTGSVFFDGSGDYLSLAPSTDFSFSNDFTVEAWAYPTDITSDGSNSKYKAIFSLNVDGGWNAQGNGLVLSIGNLHYGVGYNTDYNNGIIPINTWTHLAVTRSDGAIKIFVNGILDQTINDSNSDDTFANGTGNIPAIGLFDKNGGTPRFYFTGYISNLRVCKGHAVYTSNFIPPTRELEVHEGPDDDRTVLLCCYDAENIFADKTGRHVLAAYGDRTSSPTPTATDSPIGITTFNPGLTREVDPLEGPTFGGGAGFTSQNWLTLPKGTTAERMPVLGGIDASNARGVFAGGYSTSNINYIQISTLGNSSDFGERSVANFARPASVSSSTRGLFGGGFTSPSYTNAIDYITISSTGDGKDFGDMMDDLWARAGCSNSVRGIIAGGSDGSNTNLIEHLTISTTGNTQDFGDLTRSRREMGGSSSTTRGIFMGGRSPVPSGVNNDEDIIDYITIASTGNAVDFGNLAAARTAGASCSNATRSLYSGGNSSNAIEFVTIATLGNAVDFGDMSNALNRLGSCASSTRGIIAGGSPTNNTIEYVTIATTGDAQDFGDLSRAGKRDITGLSNGHGGLG